ncbi:probable maltase [Topomyia yanbarensis]|uniref:probable maltase n=1 Tax=Topomyia yanbarensis TaxID=2498891 RepID=UPI00273C6191|nr:probable maltase [Topomyia yanbarensis]
MQALALLLATLLVGSTSSLDWWENGNFYQVYPRSFKDSDGDGIGDLNGITQKLHYLKEIGMDGVWLSPIFASPMRDFGYDISSFYTINPEYGDLNAFDRLVNQCKALGLRLILDFVPNHTSDEHEFFKRSVKREEPYTNYYIWHPGVEGSNGTRVPPSNWISVFRGSAWEWNEARGEFYLHQFLKEQPDLNYRNPAVVEEMKNVLRYWLDKGVSGFRIDAVPYLFESAEINGRYIDEPKSNGTSDNENPAYLTHSQTMDQPETYDMIYQWRAVLDEYSARDNNTRIMMTEGYTSIEKVVEFFGNSTANGANIPFNFQLISNLNRNSTAADFAHYVSVWLNAKPDGRRSNWVLGNHDNNRLGSRLGEKKIDLYNIALQTLPDIAVTYYGEEIGMVDQWISWERTVDPAGCATDNKTYTLYSRDPARTPMQWNNGVNAGFSNASATWLPVANNYRDLNVAKQERTRKSHLSVFKELTKFRKHPMMSEGDFDMRLINNQLVAYKRTLGNAGYAVVVLNFAQKAQRINLPSVYEGISPWMVVAVSPVHNTGAFVQTARYTLAGESGIVLVYQPTGKGKTPKKPGKH